MFKQRFIPPTEVADEIAASLRRLAQDVEMERRETILRDLLTVFEQHEAMALIKFIVEPRIRCLKCNAGRSLSRSADGHCIPCFQAMRAALDVRPRT